MAVELARQLGKEFRRAGKKSILLAALFAVGLCIWLPMLWKSLFRKSDSTAKTATATTTNSTASAARVAGRVSTNETPSSDAPQQDWKRVYRRVETSDLVQALRLDELVRDPFEKGWIQAKNKPLATKTEAEIAAESDPSRFLVLSATLASRTGGAAVIGDRVYRVGQEVPDQGPIRFVLKEIRRDKVILERSGSQFELRLKDMEQASKESIDIVQ